MEESSHLADASLPQVALEVRLPIFQRVFVLHECEMTALGVALAKFLTNHLVLCWQPINQIGEMGNTEF